MGRSEMVVLAVATAAVGLFVLRVVSDLRSERVGVVGPQREAMEPGGKARVGSTDPLTAAGRVPAIHQPGQDSGRGPGRHERRMGESRRRHIALGPRDATEGGTRAAAGSVSGGSGTAGDRSGRTESRVSIADSLAPSRLRDQARHKRELVEMLGSHLRRENQLFPDAGAVDEPKEGEGGDIALHLPLEEDVQAEQSAPVEESGIDRAAEGEGMTFTEDAVLAFPDAGNASGNGGTISLEIDPKWYGSDETNNAFVNIRSQYQFENRLQLVKNGRYLRLILADDTGQETGVGLTISDWQPGDRHRVTATWGEGVASLYVDGRFIGEGKYEGKLVIPPGTPMFVGSDHGAGYSGANATLRDFTVYRRPLAQDEVLSR